ncbi:uncharacterized protein Dyak_GE27306, isoform C [Drosophila yakuba]|uniref:Uncharacterized protein, isoform C n=1 Tax=Drosophila yakuba TaxID=7245 RepID=A0A0R1EC70_DROYA|nr:uncharacterized protein Dyak_GE27729, isoform C [Drosophila yakuba]KRK05667.1 uncharacterized protein Dyak_GE27306, isoform C [Drosophila yakuba]
MPENRRYGLVITNQSSDADGVDTVALIVNANRRRCVECRAVLLTYNGDFIWRCCLPP